MDGKIKNLRYCPVISVNDDTDSGLIRVRLHPEDDSISDPNKLPTAFPLLPKMLHIKPKIGEGVLVFLAETDNGNSQRFYIGPIISQETKLYKDSYLSSQSFMYGHYVNPSIAPSTNPEMDGILPKLEDISIRGRKNSDIQITDDDIRIKSGVKVVDSADKTNEENNSMWFNKYDPAYVKVKYHSNGLINENTQKNVDNNENKIIEQVNSTATIVADKINFISNKSNEKKFETTNTNDLITDDELLKVLNEAYKLPYGEKLVEILKAFIKAFLNHKHPFVMLPPTVNDDISNLIDKKTIFLDDGQLLSDTIRIN